MEQRGAPTSLRKQVTSVVNEIKRLSFTHKNKRKWSTAPPTVLCVSRRTKRRKTVLKQFVPLSQATRPKTPPTTVVDSHCSFSGFDFGLGFLAPLEGRFDDDTLLFKNGVDPTQHILEYVFRM